MTEPAKPGDGTRSPASGNLGRSTPGPRAAGPPLVPDARFPGGSVPREVLREVAHLLRSPLGAIVMLTDLMREDEAGSLTEDQLQHLAIIQRAAMRVSAAAGDLLTLVSEHPGAETRTRLSLGETLDAVGDVVRPVTTARGSTLMVSEPGLGERLGPSTTLRRALVTLALQVALRTRDGAVELAALNGEGHLVLFSVTGKGPGPGAAFDADDAPSDSDAPTLSGESIGLAAARRLLDDLGSELRVGSDGDGRVVRLTFQLELPPVS